MHGIEKKIGHKGAGGGAGRGAPLDPPRRRNTLWQCSTNDHLNPESWTHQMCMRYHTFKTFVGFYEKRKDNQWLQQHM